jgi:hypothetical protein
MAEYFLSLLERVIRIYNVVIRTGAVLFVTCRKNINGWGMGHRMWLLDI